MTFELSVQLNCNGTGTQNNRLRKLGAADVLSDANGNILSNGLWSYSYNAHNRMIQAKQNSTIVGSYVYNGLGQRSVKTLATGKGRAFLYGPNGELLVEADQGGTVLTEYIYLDGTLLAIYQPDDNGNGSTNAQEDANNTNPATADYDGDGLSNNTEWFVTGTDARNPDTDGDGVSDSVEIAKGTDPLNNQNYPGDGDLNQDGLVDAGDLLLETQIVLGLRAPTTAQLTHGDLNQDGVITTPDLLKLQRKAPGLIALNALRALPGYEPMLAMINNASQHIQTATNKIETATRQLLASIITNAHATPPTGKLYYVHTDQLGTPQVLTDETGSVVWRAIYDPFGKATVYFGSSVEMNVRMPGQYFDAETGLHQNGYRDYDPKIGRYLESDPIGLDGGANTYRYSLNNPLRYIDQTGLCTDPGGVGSRYCIQQYIPDPTAWGFGGDNRGPTSNGGSYRASQWLTHGANGKFSWGTSPGISTFGPFSMQGNQGPSSGSESSCGNCKTYTLTNSTSNGFFPNGYIAPYATSDITITECNGKVTAISGSHTPYPNLEIWQYGNGAPKLIYNYDKGTNGPSDIGGPRIPVVIPGLN